MKKYRVKGEYEGRRIDEEVLASSRSQARLKAGFNSGNGGRMKDFLKNAKLKIY